MEEPAEHLMLSPTGQSRRFATLDRASAYEAQGQAVGMLPYREKDRKDKVLPHIEGQTMDVLPSGTSHRGSRG